MESEYQRMMLAVENYENGKMNKRTAFREIRAAEKSLLVAADGGNVLTSMIHTLAKIARLGIREAELNRKGYELF